ncbi:hypothetical protein ACJMK2_018022, partial [Sinanodonta woodiana]
MNTPRRQFSRDSICLLCGFAVIQRDISATGEIVERKLFTYKLKLTTERISTIRKVIDTFVVTELQIKECGVCTKCFKKVEHIIKIQHENEQSKAQLNDSWKNVNKCLLTPSRKGIHVVEKRLLRSPSSNQPLTKQLKVLPSVFTFISVQPLVQLATSEQLFRQSSIPIQSSTMQSMAPKPQGLDMAPKPNEK